MRTTIRLSWILLTLFFLAGNAFTASKPGERLKIGIVLDHSGEKDNGFNQYSLAGVRKATGREGFKLIYVSSRNYDAGIHTVIKEGAHLVITIGYLLREATEKAARAHPTIQFITVDYAYSPGAGCSASLTDCYSREGGLTNVTSILFAEDQVAYLAGTLAGCMSRSGKVATVAGLEIPPVVRFVTGFENGAKSIRPDIITLHQYVPDFHNPAAGKIAARSFIDQGADVIFGAAGTTGNGALLSAAQAGVMAIGVDLDQYESYPQARSVLLTSAMKKVEVATESVVLAFADGKLKPGVRLANLADGGIGLAPYHDWENKIPQECKDKVVAAEAAIIADPEVTRR